jgi:hypothetical protein
MNRTLYAPTLLGLLLLTVTGVEAQRLDPGDRGPYVAWGGHLAYAFTDDALGIGPRMEAGIRPVALIGSFDYFFPRCGAVGCSLFQLNGQAKLEPGLFPAMRPYVGAGTHYRRFSIRTLQGRDVSTGSSFHAMAGFWRGATFLEGKYEFEREGNPSQWVLTLGALF